MDSPNHPIQLVLMSPSVSDKLWLDNLLYPTYVAGASVLVFLLEILLRSKSTQDPEEDEQDGVNPPTAVAQYIRRQGGLTILAFKTVKLLCCAALLALSAVTVLAKDIHTLQSVLLPYLLLSMTFVYTFILSFLALTTLSLSEIASRYASAVLLVAWAVYVYRDIWPLATYTLVPADVLEGPILWVKVALLTVAGVLVPLFIPRRYIPVDPKEPMVPNPEQTACIVSMCLFSYIDKTVVDASRVSHLGLEQLPPLADSDHMKNMAKRTFPQLDPLQTGKRRHLFWGLMTVFRKEYLLMCSMLLSRTMWYLASPVAMNRLLTYLETGGEGAFVRPFVWVGLLLAGPVLGSISFQYYIFLSSGSTVRASATMTQLLFEHALRLRVKAETSDKSAPSTAATTPDTASLAPGTADGEDTATATVGAGTSDSSQSTVAQDKQKSKADAKSGESTKDTNLVGQIMNMISSDLNNISNGRDFVFLIVEVPIQLSLCTWFLYSILGWSVFVGIAFMVVTLPLPGYLTSLIQGIQAEKMKRSDARMQTVTESLNVIRMIKLFGWEQRILGRVEEKRDRELAYIRKFKLVSFTTSYTSWLIPTVSMIVTYTVRTLGMKQVLTASAVFSSISIFEVMREEMHQAFGMFTRVVQAKVSLDRIDNFLNNSELLDEFTDHSAKPVIPPTNFPPEAIGFQDATFTWSKENDGTLTPGPQRRNFTLRAEGELLFKRGRINLIVGPTGCGKTSMLMALLGEMHYIPSGPRSYFNLPRGGGVAYAAQESWVQNETIKDNILFGSPYDEERYKKVILQCGLKRDLELLDAGDETEVGEKGLTLSGGQKARITLARAIYSPAEIVLLDDVLAALDVHTAHWIVDKCFRGDLIRGRTIILVTHNVALASTIAQFVVSLGTDGRVHSQGSLADALEHDHELSAEFAEQVMDEDIAKEDIDEAPLDAPEKKITGKLVVAEEVEEGRVSWAAWKLLLGSIGGNRPVLFWLRLVSLILIVELLDSLKSWVLGLWAHEYEVRPSEEVSVSFYTSVYVLLQGINVILMFIAVITYIHGSMVASRKINDRLVSSILSATLRWLDMTPVSRIITRCTQDINAIDGPITDFMFWIVELGLIPVMKLSVIVILTPSVIAPGSLVAFMAGVCAKFYLRAQLSVKREMSIAQAPVVGHFGAALSGITSIRAYSAQNTVRQEAYRRIDRQTRATRTLWTLNSWLGVRIDALGAVFTAGLASLLLYGGPYDATRTGFSLHQAVIFGTNILWFITLWNELEISANSVERILQYLTIQREPAPTERGIPPAYWPASGDLKAEKLSARYSADGPRVLHEISFHVKSGERVGIVGRTGSGKSSLTLALLRCILTEGKVYYDGIPTNSINLEALRSSITIIPQAPELLSGTLRENLDPFGEHDDVVLNGALRAAGLFSVQKDTDESRLTLDSEIASGGGNLSIGQRQILALARAIVRQSKLLILDEATSAIDYETDTVIQTSLREKLGKDVTLLTIAHRLQTIMDADKIMVLDAGHIVEFGKPSELLKNERGMLRALVDESSDREHLYAMTSGAKGSSA